MNKKIIYIIVSLLFFVTRSEAQPRLPAGYPPRDQSFDVLQGFIKPPKGYGEVPFYWWQGDTLTHERLLWQLDQLKDKGIPSLQINYSHLDSGGLTYGLSNPSKPPLFSDSWWKLFKWFAAEAAKRGMSVSLSDYTLGIGQGFSMDEALKENPGLNGSSLRLKTYFMTGSVHEKMPDNILSVNACMFNRDSSVIAESKKDLLLQLTGNFLNYNFGKDTLKVTTIYYENIIPSFDPMNPRSGKSYKDHFFEKFAQALPEKGSGTLNFFFSDELNFRLNGLIWNDNFAFEFNKRKGYDLIPYLDALFMDIGPITPKIRLDYNDVMVSLSEENFFRPVYQWHQDRGLIYGCDHGGRGLDVAEFGDYFRTQRWNQGPGSDQPMLSKNIIKAKVASSIAHLYERPRVWLEGFHSSGWGTSSADITDAVFANFVAGYNLLSFHGLYYSTRGGWWEWAPPDNHFRMPYWKQIDPLMNCIQRLSYLMSQGYHRCDVAIIYPTEPVIAEMDGENSVKTAFDAGEALYDKGIDFDFIDYESLARSEIKDGEVNVSGEKYKVLIIPSMKAIRFASLEKIEEFRHSGGIIVNIGALPEATEKNGMNDLSLAKRVDWIFSDTVNVIKSSDPESVPLLLSGKYQEDFKILTPVKERPYTMHRILGNREVFAIYNLPEGTKCFFRAKGQPQLWNPWTGETSSLSAYATETADGTEITTPLTTKDIQLIVFDSINTTKNEFARYNKVLSRASLGNTWEFELKPSLDNQWGDYLLPATNELMGANVRQLDLLPPNGYQGGKLIPDKTWKKVTVGFGVQFLKLGPLPELPSDKELTEMNTAGTNNEYAFSGKKYRWEEYPFSWQFGVEGDYGHQGYHGLKGDIYDNFIRLGDIKEVKMSKVRVPGPEGHYYILKTSVIAPGNSNYELLSGEVKPVKLIVNSAGEDPESKNVFLRKGANTLEIVYDRACETYLVFRNQTPVPPARNDVSMRWFGDSGVLPFDPSPGVPSSGLFTFESLSGLKSLSFSAYGKATSWIDGIQVNTEKQGELPDGLGNYGINLKNPSLKSARVVIKIEYQPGHADGGAFPRYIDQLSGKGSITLGDWSETDGMKAYSGGVMYRKSFYIEDFDSDNRIEIDLGDVVSSAAVYINGTPAGTKVAPPWKFDVTKLARKGDNQIEVLVYNTLANNYITTPTRYRGSIKSGLIGPVTLTILSKE